MSYVIMLQRSYNISKKKLHADLMYLHCAVSMGSSKLFDHQSNGPEAATDNGILIAWTWCVNGCNMLAVPILKKRHIDSDS